MSDDRQKSPKGGPRLLGGLIRAPRITRHHRQECYQDTEPRPMDSTHQVGEVMDFPLHLERSRVDLAARQAQVNRDLERLAAAIKGFAGTGMTGNIREDLDILYWLVEAGRSVGDALDALTAPEVGQPVPTYAIGSLFLYDSFRYLNQKEVESLHYVTGVQLGQFLTLERLITFQMDRQTTGSARGDVHATHRALMELDRYGHKLHGCIHIHPGRGSGAVLPSAVDLEHQERLERGGYRAIGGVFSRDGYFRAFSSSMSFQIIFYGKGVEQINEHLIRLTDIHQSEG